MFAPGATPEVLVEPVLAGRGDDARHVRAVTVRSRPGAAVVREVAARDDAPAEFGQLRDAGVDDRDADALAGQRPDPLRPSRPRESMSAPMDWLVTAICAATTWLLESWSACRVVGQRRQRPRGHVDDRARRQPLRDAQPVARRQRVHLRVGARDDDARLPLVPGAQALGQVAGQAARAAPVPTPMSADTEEDGSGTAQRSTRAEGSGRSKEKRWP